MLDWVIYLVQCTVTILGGEMAGQYWAGLYPLSFDFWLEFRGHGRIMLWHIVSVLPFSMYPGQTYIRNSSHLVSLF